MFFGSLRHSRIKDLYKCFALSEFDVQNNNDVVHISVIEQIKSSAGIRYCQVYISFLPGFSKSANQPTRWILKLFSLRVNTFKIFAFFKMLNPRLSHSMTIGLIFWKRHCLLWLSWMVIKMWLKTATHNIVRCYIMLIIKMGWTGKNVNLVCFVKPKHKILPNS